jgi:hypothetical protein
LRASAQQYAKKLAWEKCLKNCACGAGEANLFKKIACGAREGKYKYSKIFACGAREANVQKKSPAAPGAQKLKNFRLRRLMVKYSKKNRLRSQRGKYSKIFACGAGGANIRTCSPVAPEGQIFENFRLRRPRRKYSKMFACGA